MFDFYSPEVQMVATLVVVLTFSVLGLAMLAIVGRSIIGGSGDRPSQRTAG